MEIDELIQRLLQAAPHANVGRGAEHPTNPDLSLVERTATWLSVHPFLSRDIGYIDFLNRYSGVDVLSEYSAENVAKGLDWDVKIPGLSSYREKPYIGSGPFGKFKIESVATIDETGHHGSDLDPTAPNIDENGFYKFADVCFRASGEGQEPGDWAYEDFGFDATGQRRPGVYRLSRNPQWLCENFSEWLKRVIDSRGRIFPPEYTLGESLPKAPVPPPPRLALASFYCGIVSMFLTIMCMGIVGVPLGLVGVVFACIILVRRKSGTEYALGGLIFGILAIALLPVVGSVVKWALTSGK